MVFNFVSEDIIRSPFPYGVKEKFFEPSHYQKLSAAFPSDQWFSYNSTFGDRQDLAKGTDLFNKFLEDSPLWKETYNQFNSDKYIQYYLALLSDQIEKFGGRTGRTNLRFVDNYSHMTFQSRIANRLHINKLYEKYSAILSACQQDPLFIDFVFFRAKNGYMREIHTDNRHKLFYMLIYFNSTDENSIGGELVLHEHLDSKKRMNDFERFPDEKDVRSIAVLKPMENRGVLVLNCNNSYHSVTKLENHVDYRNTIYIAVSAQKRFWNGQPTELNFG